MTDKGKPKSCFVIAPIGKDGSEIRDRSDKVLKHIITPCAVECGYTEPVRADTLNKTGLITNQIIDRILGDTLVVADLTGHNPNVFYELAIRHAVRLPVIHMIQSGESIPFDVAGMRTVKVDHCDLDSVAQAKAEMIAQIRDVETTKEPIATPISTAIDLQRMSQSGDADERTLASVLDLLHVIRSEVSRTSENASFLASLAPSTLPQNVTQPRPKRQVRRGLCKVCEAPVLVFMDGTSSRCCVCKSVVEHTP